MATTKKGDVAIVYILAMDDCRPVFLMCAFLPRKSLFIFSGPHGIP